MKHRLNGIGSAALLVLCLLLIAAICLPGSASAADDPPKVDNGLPVVYLNIDESRGTIEDMIRSGDHSVYCYGKLSIDVPEGFHYSDFPDLACVSFEDLDMSIRGRGNSTWREAKKPFKIKLDKKADLFGLGSNGLPLHAARRAGGRGDGRPELRHAVSRQLLFQRERARGR